MLTAYRTPRQRVQVYSLNGEQPALGVQTKAKASRRAASAHDTVTGNDKGQGVCATSAPCGPRRLGAAEACRELAVGEHLASRNAAQRFPNVPLKRSRRRCERQSPKRIVAAAKPSEQSVANVPPERLRTLGHARTSFVEVGKRQRFQHTVRNVSRSNHGSEQGNRTALDNPADTRRAGSPCIQANKIAG